MRDVEYATMHEQEMVHWWFRGRRRLLTQLLADSLADAVGRSRILDFGCGTGGNSTGYTAFGSVVGIEPDRSALRYAAGRQADVEGPRVHYCRAIGTALPLTSAAFDVVVASDVLEHVADDGAAVAEIARVLRPGGTLVFSVPAHPWLWSAHDHALWHQRRYRRRDLRRLLAGAGFRLAWLSYWNSALFPVVALRRLIERCARDGAPISDATVPPPILNMVLGGVLRAEAAALRWVRFPMGVSLVGRAILGAH